MKYMHTLCKRDLCFYFLGIKTCMCFNYFSLFPVCRTVSHRDPCLIENSIYFPVQQSTPAVVGITHLESGKCLCVLCILCLAAEHVKHRETEWSKCVLTHTGQSLIMCRAVLWQVNTKMVVILLSH